MSWEIIKHHNLTSKIDQTVSVKVYDLEYHSSTTVEELTPYFKAMLEALPSSNAYTPSFMYKMRAKDEKTAEIWKVKPSGEDSALMFTMRKQSTTFNPFTF